ncbi:thioredoxin domain-containing protein [Sneathiella sp. P13V-1]|uniref:DsbA family protein n=1 Tax=Sneathiella sp. P13V-1 TaxID=2697366 RepID=UPI00187B73E0|nr:DsbA family protein [Sneathiella sp. P13V-1]MBE7637170.1 thioredoxin domain-containing protein [Sneathiella sp. P13V-1]
MNKNSLPAPILAAVAISIVGALIFLFYREITPKQEYVASADKEFGAQVRAYLLENPTVIREAVERLQLAEAREEEIRKARLLTDLKDEIENDGYSFVGGNPNGDVTIVEFFDYRCGYCKRSFPDLMKTVEDDGNIRLVMKEFPILGEQSVLAARAVTAAREQGKYMEFHNALMQLRGGITKDRLMNIAKDLGMDAAKLEKDMGSEKITAEFRRTYDLAQALGITGTPAFIIGGQLAPGAIPQARMKQLVAQARDKTVNTTTN